METETTEESNEENGTRPGPSKTRVTKKQKSPPPIVIHGIINQHHKLVQDLSSTCKGKFYIRYTDNTNIYTENREDWLAVRALMEEKKLAHYTFTSHEDKHHAFVLKGMKFEADVDDIKRELSCEYKLNINNIYKMRGTKRSCTSS